MDQPELTIVPGPGARPSTPDWGALALLALGGAFGLGGGWMAVSVMFNDDPELSISRPVLSLILVGTGGLLVLLGLRRMPAPRDVEAPRAPAGGGSGTLILGLIPEHQGTAVAPARPRAQHVCGAWIEPGDLFCKGCGWPLAERPCPSCRIRNDPDARFCRRCGAALTLA